MHICVAKRKSLQFLFPWLWLAPPFQGNELYRCGEYKEALKFYDRAVTSEPDNALRILFEREISNVNEPQFVLGHRR